MSKESNPRHPLLRAIAKRFVNPVMLKFAGSRYSPIVAIRHIGRRSGKTYKTPLVVRRSGNGFLIALTYGPNVDWYRNIQVAGGGALIRQGREYAIGVPQPIPAEEGLRGFPLPARLILKLSGTTDFVVVPSRRAARAV